METAVRWVQRAGAGGLLLLACLLSSGTAADSRDIWLLVDTGNLTLSVMRRDETLKTFDNIAIGSNGATRQKRVGDERTPLGDYRIVAIRSDSRFHRFLAIDYPAVADARRGLEDGRISRAEYDRLRQERRRSGVPPQDTSLGGNLGIHGIGAGDPAIHEAFNWTNGCIALTNEQVDALLPWVRVGTPVSVR